MQRVKVNPQTGGNELRKLMLMAAMLAMVLVAAAPALAQDAVAGDVDNSTDTTTTYINVDCSQVQDAAAAQYGGDAVALGDAAAASVANELGISQEQVNACLGGVAGGGDVTVNGVDDDADGVVDEADEAAAAEAGAAAGDAAAAGGTTVLPDTGGASLFTLGAGALLVGGGLLARRIFR